MEEFFIGNLCCFMTLYLAYCIGIKHKIGFVHRYHYTNIQQDNIIPFCKVMGLGTCIMGFGLLIRSYVNLFSIHYSGDYLLLGSVIIGFGIQLICIIKYNGSIFGLIRRK